MSTILPFHSISRPVGKFVHVEFGNPKKKDCAGFGICNVESASHRQSGQRSCCEDCKSMGHLSYVRSDNRFVLQFRRADLTDKAYARHFATGAFLIEEDFFVPHAIAQACGLPQHAVISSGLYSFRELEGRLQINFPNIPVTAHSFSMSRLPQISLNF